MTLNTIKTKTFKIQNNRENFKIPKSAYEGILWVHDVYYDMLRIFYTFNPLLLYLYRKKFRSIYHRKYYPQLSFSVALFLCL